METPCLHGFISSKSSVGSVSVTIPFDDEYQIRLKNGNDRKCTAAVFIDGAPVSKIGDIILNAGNTLDLERFLDSSLTEGKRFKFVRLDHPDVDDPTREENGLVRVEFKLEREPKAWKVPQLDESQWIYRWHFSDGISDLNGVTFYLDTAESYYHGNSSVFCSNTSSTALGATVQGGNSDQAFTRYANIDVEDKIYALELRIVGINEVSFNWPPHSWWPW